MEELLNKLLELFKAEGVGGISPTNMLWGDPQTYASFNLPSLAVAPAREEIKVQTTARDRHDNMVSIFIIRDARDGFNNVTNEASVDRQLTRDVATVNAILRGNITLDDRVAECTGCSVQYVPGRRNSDKLRVAQVNAGFMYYKTRQR